MRALFLLAIFAIGTADVYRWVDTEGVVHYSDMPNPGAERIVIDPAPSTGATSAPTAPGDSSSGTDQSQEQSVRYDSVTIQSPTQDQVLWNIGGQLDVAVTVEPPLQPGHTLQLYLDNLPVQTLSPDSTTAQLSAVYRGAHTLRAAILDASGTSLLQSPTVGFVVHQTSITNPQNPLIPKPTPR